MLHHVKKLEYQYDIDEQEITIFLDTGGTAKINMETEYFMYYGFNCDIELPFISDDCKDIIFRCGGEFYTVQQLIQWAENNYVSIHNDALQTARDEAKYYE